MNTLLVTGSSGLIGSEVCNHFAKRGWKVYGIDNNQRAVFFGAAGDTRWNQARLQAELGQSFVHMELDIRDRAAVLAMMAELMQSMHSAIANYCLDEQSMVLNYQQQALAALPFAQLTPAGDITAVIITAVEASSPVKNDDE